MLAVLPRVVDAVLVLPTLSEQLSRVDRHTEALEHILAELRAVQADTACLPGVHSELAAMREVVIQVEENTLAVEQLAETLVPLQGAAARVGRFADRIPQRRVAGS